MNQNATPQQPTGSSGMEPNVASLLCYLCSWVTGLIFLLIEKNDKNVRFHAWQSIILGIAMTAVYIVLWILMVILAAISPGLASIFGIFLGIAGLLYFAVAVLLMFKAYQGEKFKLPMIGDLAEQQNNKA